MKYNLTKRIPKNPLREPMERDMAAPSGEPNAAPLTEGGLQAHAPTAQSWGERYGLSTLLFTRNWVINYFINFTIGAVGAYKFETSQLGKRTDVWLDRQAAKLSFLKPSTAKFVIAFPTRNQFLLLGGHALLPVLKVMKDNQQRLTLWTSHKLDQLQESLGYGNEASKRSLAEYSHITELMQAGNPAALTERDKTMLAKHNITNDLKFDEYTQSWWTVIKARLIAMTCSTAASMGLGWISGQKSLPKFLQFRPEVERPFGQWVAKNFITKTPGLRSFFKNRPELIGEYFLDDAILTVVSAGVYNLVEAADEKLHHEAKAKRHAAAHPTHTVSGVVPEGAVTHAALAPATQRT